VLAYHQFDKHSLLQLLKIKCLYQCGGEHGRTRAAQLMHLGRDGCHTKTTQDFKERLKNLETQYLLTGPCKGQACFKIPNFGLDNVMQDDETRADVTNELSFNGQ
jgi:hypothetical protein